MDYDQRLCFAHYFLSAPVCPWIYSLNLRSGLAAKTGPIGIIGSIECRIITESDVICLPSASKSSAGLKALLY